MKIYFKTNIHKSMDTLRLRHLPICFHLDFDWEHFNFQYNSVKGVHKFSIYLKIFYWSIDIMFYESEKITITKEQFDSLQKKADKWDILEKKIGKLLL